MPLNKEKYFSTKNWTDIIELDRNRINYLHKIKFTKPFPNDFTFIAKETIVYLRDSLDQAAYAVAVASGIANPKRLISPCPR